MRKPGTSRADSQRPRGSPADCGIAYRDETWRLALARDTAALRAAAALLDGYDARRAVAFAEAVDGRLEPALAELRSGAEDGWPFEPARALDAARARYLAGDPDGALRSLREARSADVPDPAVAELAAMVGPRRRALPLVLGRGTIGDRLRGALRVLRGW